MKGETLLCFILYTQPQQSNKETEGGQGITIEVETA